MSARSEDKENFDKLPKIAERPVTRPPPKQGKSPQKDPRLHSKETKTADELKEPLLLDRERSVEPAPRQAARVVHQASAVASLTSQARASRPNKPR